MSESTALVPATNQTFSLDDALNVAWERTWKNIWPMVGICTATFLYSMVPQLLTTIITWVSSSPGLIMLALLLSLGGLILSCVFSLGYLNLWLRILDGKPVVTRDVFTTFNRVGPFIGASFLYHIIVTAGYFCFILPGIFLQLSLQFYGYFIIEYKLGPVASLKASYEITKGIKIDLFLLGVVQGFIGFVGTLCLLVGGFPAWIINSLSTAHVFRQLMANLPEERLIGLIPDIAQVKQLNQLTDTIATASKGDDSKPEGETPADGSPGQAGTDEPKAEDNAAVGETDAASKPPGTAGTDPAVAPPFAL